DRDARARPGRRRRDGRGSRARRAGRPRRGDAPVRRRVRRGGVAAARARRARVDRPVGGGAARGRGTARDARRARRAHGVGRRGARQRVRDVPAPRPRLISSDLVRPRGPAHLRVGGPATTHRQEEPVTEALRRLLDRAGVRTATGRGAVLAAVVAAVTVALFLGIERVLATDVGATFGAGPGETVLTPGVRTAVLALVVAQAGALVLRRRAPLACLALTVVAQVAITALLPPYVGFQAPATLVAAYSAGAYAPRRLRLAGPAVAALAQVVLVFALGGFAVPSGAGPAQHALQVGGSLVSALLTFVGAALVGTY